MFGAILKCKRCDNEAKFAVWYEGCGGLYAHLCTKHCEEDVRNGNSGYKVSAIQPIEKDSNGYKYGKP